MTAFGAFFRGLGTALGAPVVVLLLWLLNGALVLPAAWSVADALEEDVGKSLVHEDLRAGFDMDWHSEFEDRASGLAETFEPRRVVGISPFLHNLEALANGGWLRESPVVVGLLFLHGLAWLLLLGGILDRFANRGPMFSLSRFLETGGQHFFPLLRLALVCAPLYFLVYKLAAWGMGLIGDLARSSTRELPVLIAASAATLGTLLLLHLVRMISDYAKVMLVLGERRSALAAAFSGLGFVLRHPLRTWGVDLLFAGAGLALLGGYHLVAPGVNQATAWAVFGAFALGQAYVLLRIVLRLGLLAAELEVYRLRSPL